MTERRSFGISDVQEDEKVVSEATDMALFVAADRSEMSTHKSYVIVSDRNRS